MIGVEHSSVGNRKNEKTQDQMHGNADCRKSGPILACLGEGRSKASGGGV